MIDLSSLEPLPLRRQRDKMDRERLADIAHRKKCATHKGRNHWRNWEHRKMLAQKKAERAAKLDTKKPAMARYGDEVRRFWQGERDDMPAKPLSFG